MAGQPTPPPPNTYPPSEIKRLIRRPYQGKGPWLWKSKGPPPMMVKKPKNLKPEILGFQKGTVCVSVGRRGKKEVLTSNFGAFLCAISRGLDLSLDLFHLLPLVQSDCKFLGSLSFQRKTGLKTKRDKKQGSGISHLKIGRLHLTAKPPKRK